MTSFRVTIKLVAVAFFVGIGTLMLTQGERTLAAAAFVVAMLGVVRVYFLLR